MILEEEQPQQPKDIINNTSAILYNGENSTLFLDSIIEVPSSQKLFLGEENNIP